jgi:uncharacterized membrane protein
MFLRRWLLAGLVVWIPLGVTLLVFRFILNLLDAFLLLVPAAWRPEAWGVHIPGLGALLSVVLLLLTGALASNYLGARLFSAFERGIERIPAVRSLYGGVKQLVETLMSRQSTAFKHVVLIQYPRQGIWSLGFQAGTPLGLPAVAAGGEDFVTVFVPTTPVPTAGFLIQVPRAEVVWLDLSLEEGMRYLLSMGVVMPGSVEGDGPPRMPAPPVG